MDDSVYVNLALHLVPFFNIFREDMEENINRLAQDLERCCVDNADVEIIQTGSGFEGLSLPHLEKNTAWNTDADHMIIRTDLIVHEGLKIGETNAAESVKEANVELDYTGGLEHGASSANAIEVARAENFVYIYDASHAGYVHLTHNKSFQRVAPASVREHCLQNSLFIERSKDLIPLSHTAVMALEGGTITGPSYSLPYTGGSFRVNRDFVYGLKCTFWPLQAEEWIHRDRAQWPSAETISTISSHGCHIVPVGSHNSSLTEFEWRFSFSVAELILARSLSQKQKLAYCVLKALIKNEMKFRGIDVFASYHLKTCLFWFLEKKGIESWSEKSLGTNILELLDFFIAFYSSGSVPNYFISQNNMIDHRSSEDIFSACHALRDIRDNITHSLCRYIDTNQSLPVLFDIPLTQQLNENSGKFVQNCKYNFLVMALAYLLKKEKSGNSSNNCVEANSLVNRARILHQAAHNEQYLANLHTALIEASAVSDAAENATANMVLSLLELYLSADQMKVTESSAVALAVFNVFLTLHPTNQDTDFDKNSLEFHKYLTNPAFKEVLLWAARIHETYSDVIYDFVVKKWKNGPHFCTDDDEAKKFMKLLMIILGKPTKQASAVTGSLVKRGIEGERFMIMRGLADYLLHVHLESSFIAFQAVAYLMGSSVLSEIYIPIKWSTYPQSKVRAIELILTKQELQAQLPEEEFARLIQMHETNI